MAAGYSVSMTEVKNMLIREGMYLIENDEDIAKMLDVMVRFYSADALFGWLCDNKYDETVVKNIMRAALYLMPNTIAYADSADFNAVAAWVPPGYKGLSVIQYIRNGAYELYKHRGFKIINRLLTYQRCASKMHRNITGHKDWYLFSYAVNPDCDSFEYSEKILRPITKYGWDRGEACYCEVTSDTGINIMKAAGFQVRDQGRIPGSSVNYYGVMV